jgi:hypothetical protein
MTNSKNFAIVTTVALLASTAESFGISTSTSKSHQPLTSLSAQNDSRRNFLRSAAGLAFGTVAFTSNEEPASASYSAYTNREKDWEERKKTGGAFCKPGKTNMSSLAMKFYVANSLMYHFAPWNTL